MNEPENPPCAKHAERLATTRCAGCGQALCSLCSNPHGADDWCDSCSPGSRIPARGALPADPFPLDTLLEADGQRHRLPPLLFFLVAVQTAASIVAAVAAWRATSTARVLFEQVTAETAPQPPLPPPSLDSTVPSTLTGNRLDVTGRAPFGALVVILLDGTPVQSRAVVNGLFAASDVPISPGDHQLTLVAYGEGRAIESGPVAIRVQPENDEAARSAEPTHTPPRSSGRESSGEGARNVVRGRSRQQIALTFDGGSHAGQAVTVLDALEGKVVRSTIFLTGDFIRLYPDVVRRIVADGHEVGNHMLTHPHLANWVPGRGHVTRPGVDREFVLQELADTEHLFEQATGRRLSRFWRAPYGEVNSQILDWAQTAGWTHIGWTEGLDTLDWVANPEDRLYRSASEIRERLLSAARSGDRARGGIVLMHLGGERQMDQPASELPTIIDGLRAEGYQLVTVSALLGG